MIRGQLVATWGLLCCLMGSGIASRATHLLGGELTYTFIGFTTTGQAQYTLRCYIYRDCSSANVNGTGFDLSIPIAVYQGNQLVTTATAPFNASLVESIVPVDPNSCAELPPDLCIERATYVTTVALSPSAAPYVLSHQRCCRSPAIVNLVGPEDTGFTLTTTIPGGDLVTQPNSSPSFGVLPQAFICNGLPFALDNSATDPDGDSLSYSICPIYLGGDPLAPIPNPPLGPAFVPVTWSAGYSPEAPLGIAAGMEVGADGILEGVPGVLGKFALGVCVEEWRNGILINRILRDFTLDVVQCSLSAPVYAEVVPCNGLDVQFDLLANPAETYAWDFGTGLVSDVSDWAEPSFLFPEPGSYTVTLLYTAGDCAGSTVFEVVAAPSWEPEIVAGTPFCSQGGWWIPLSPPMGLPEEATWNWLFSTTSTESPVPSEALNSTPSQVWFPAGAAAEVTLVANAWGCRGEAAANWNLPELPFAAFEVAVPPCSGGEVTFENNSTDAQTFLWHFGYGNATSTQPQPNHVFPGWGNYEVTLIAGLETGCPDTLTSDVQVLPVNPFIVGYEILPQSLCDSAGWMVFSFTGSGADAVTWDLEPWGTGSGTPWALQFPEPGNYEGNLILYHEACDITWVEPLNWTVSDPLQGVNIRVPNVISPNNDGSNERFGVQFLDDLGVELGSVPATDFASYHLQVYNRWGNLMFDTNDPNRSWWSEGAPEGTYYFVVTGQHLCDTQPFVQAGDVTVVR